MENPENHNPAEDERFSASDSGERATDLPVSPEDEFVEAQEAFAEAIKKETVPVRLEVSRLAWDETVKLVDYLKDKPEARRHLSGFLGKFADLGDDVLFTQKARDIRDVARRGLSDEGI